MAVGRRTQLGGGLANHLLQDLRFAVRQIFRSPGFSIVAVLTLALGVGATTAIFSVVDGIVFRQLPFPEPGELTAVWADWTRRGGPANEWVNFPDYYALKERSRTLEAVGAWDNGSLTMTGVGDPEFLSVGMVSYDLFPMVLQASPFTGRNFLPEDDVPGAQGTVILSDGFWRGSMGSDPSVVGSGLTLDGDSYVVLGVMGPDFDPPFTSGADVWVPLRQDLSDHDCGRGGACLRAIARLASGVSLAEAQSEATDIAGQLQELYPETNLNAGFTLRPMRGDIVADARRPLLTLLAAVGFVLLIACVNIANLLMARTTARRSELAIRSALGARRHRMITQLLTESAVLAFLGGAMGLGFAFLGSDALMSLAPAGTPRLEEVRVDGRVLLFALAATILSGVLFGVVPAMRATTGRAVKGLAEGGRDAARGVTGIRTRNLLVSGQIALALILLVGAGLFLRSFANLRSLDLGFRPEGVVTAQLSLPESRYPDADALRAFRVDLEARMSALPGVSAAGTTSWLPLTGFGNDTDFYIEGRPMPPLGQNQAVWFRRVSPGYLDAIGLRLVSGRWFNQTDRSDAPRVVVINSGLAGRFFSGVDPVGQRINLGNPEVPQWREVVGVVADARHFGIRDGSRDALYFPFDQGPSRSMFVAIRSSRDPSALSSELRGVLSQLDPFLAVAGIMPLESRVSEALGPDRFVATVMALFGGLALALAIVGLYGVVSYSVGLRLREMGVRLALGASGTDVRRLVLVRSSGPVSLGLVVGFLGGLVLMRLVESLLFEVSATDPWTFALVALLLACAAGTASYLPALRATRVNPVEVLREG